MSVPGAEGYFISSSFTLPNGNTPQTLYFYPAPSFMGGVVAFNINGTSEKGDCVLMQEIEIPVCDGKDKQVDELPKQNIVFIAPNPAKTSTTLHYQLITEGAVTVELYDAMGRTVWQTLEKENKGSIVIDCEKYAEGYYRVLVKQNGAIIHQSKLIIKQ